MARKNSFLLTLLLLISPAAAPAQVVFLDNFDGPELGVAWTVLHPNAAYYAVSGGRLHTQTRPGDVWQSTNDYQNLFLIQNPAGNGDFQVTLRVLGFNPTTHWQQIDIVAYDDDDNLVRCINGYVSGGRHWEFGAEIAGTWTTDIDATGAGVSDFYLRLIKVGNIYRQFYSMDGITYQAADNAPVMYGNGAPQYLGLVALEGSGVGATPVPVDLDFFQVETVPPVPEDFRDDFDGDSLGQEWIVLHPNAAEYSLSGGELHTSTLEGDLYKWTNDYQNLFLVRNPFGSGNFRVTLKVSGFNPSSNYQQIIVVAYDEDNNHARCANGFIDGQRNWQSGKEVAGVYSGTLDSLDAGVANFYLRLVKIGNTYRQSYSIDGVHFHERNGPITYGNGSPEFLGFIALQGSGLTQTPANISLDFFALERPAPLTPVFSLMLD